MIFLTRKLVTPADLNPRGTLHGGQLLKWIDEEGGIHACLELDTGLIVTKYISEIDFKLGNKDHPESLNYTPRINNYSKKIIKASSEEISSHKLFLKSSLKKNHY